MSTQRCQYLRIFYCQLDTVGYLFLYARSIVAVYLNLFSFLHTFEFERI